MVKTYSKAELKKILSKDYRCLETEYGLKLYNSEKYIKITNNIIQGIYFQRSWHDRIVCITIFIQPLFILDDVMHLSHGFRMDDINTKKDVWLELNQQGNEKISKYIRDVALPFFESNKSAEKIISSANLNEYAFLWKTKAWSTIFCLAFSAAAANNKEMCFSKIEELKELKQFIHPEFDWMKQRLTQIEELKEAVSNGTQEELLSNNIIFMKQKIKLADY